MSYTPTETKFYDFPASELPFKMSGGGELPEVRIAYETYGEMNAEGTNVVVVMHALSGSQHAAGYTESVEGVGDLWNKDCKKGWWDDFVGPGKAVNTNKFFVVCANFLGGCYGSTGPRSINPKTGKPYGGTFPSLSFLDIIRTQRRLLGHLGAKKVHAIVGSSVGGMIGLSMATHYPELVNIVVAVGTGSSLSSLQRIHNYEQILAIQQDRNFNEGDYYGGPKPDEGLALARIIAHKTYVSISTVEDRASREILQPNPNSNFYQLSHRVESYMANKGARFTCRFDANTYLRIMQAWQRFDLAKENDKRSIVDAFKKCRHQKYMVFSIDSDVCFYPDEQLKMVRELKEAEVPCRYITVHSDKGHDSFLLEPELYTPYIAYTLENEW